MNTNEPRDTIPAPPWFEPKMYKFLSILALALVGCGSPVECAQAESPPGGELKPSLPAEPPPDLQFYAIPGGNELVPKGIAVGSSGVLDDATSRAGSTEGTPSAPVVSCTEYLVWAQAKTGATVGVCRGASGEAITLRTFVIVASYDVGSDTMRNVMVGFP